mmetsp:Transcript_7193/g.8229  ORF Transcript_7193/g.8229 Transcript_7193/m.8229 type:complete len:329 (-) Transcript_7193:94-1080(-)
MNTTKDDDDEADLLYTIIFNVILLFFVAGMTATCSLDNLLSKFRSKGILVGLSIQFFLNPLIGLLVINIVELEPEEEVILLVLLSSPGGTYSNLLCSFFNADLALSVSMSAISTLAAVVMLPFNVYLYVEVLSGSEAKLNWAGLSATIVCVELGVGLGIILGKRFGGKKYQRRFNMFGNVSGIVLLVLAILLSSNEEPFWEKPPVFWAGTAMPPLIGASMALVVSSFIALPKPDRLSVIVETVYQNTSIPTAVAFATFSSAAAKKAAAIPVVYGLIQATLSVSVLVVGWKAGWSYAPEKERFRTIILNTYQPYESGDNNEKESHSIGV